jgi:hypothetical protein
MAGVVASKVRKQRAKEALNLRGEGDVEAKRKQNEVNLLEITNDNHRPCKGRRHIAMFACLPVSNCLSCGACRMLCFAPINW